jgi:Baseplate J-like protein
MATTNPFATPPVITGLTIPASVDYTSKDFLGFMSSLQTYVATAMPDWDIGTSEGDIGLAIIEAFAYEGDILSYYGDRISQEAYLPTATQRQSLLNIAALLGYTVSNGTPAIGSVTLQTFAGSPATTVPPLTQLMTGFNAITDTTVVYEVDPGQASYLVPANGGTLPLTVTQGETISNYTVGTSVGTAAQAFSLPQTGIIDGTVSVQVTAVGGTAVQWSYVQFLGDFGPGDLVYTTYLDSTGLTWVQFGDNVNGAIPVSGGTITATYRVGQGSAGNVSAGSVGTFLTPITGVATQLISNAYVSTAMTGGTDPETNDQIRTNAPAAFTTIQRAVSLDDFESIAENVPGITTVAAVALHSTSVTLYLMGNNNQPASSTQQASVLAAFAGKTLAGVTVSTAAPTLVAVDVTAQIQVLPSYSNSGVLASVESSLNTMLSNPNTTFGQLLTVGGIYGTILGVAGVAYAVVTIISREDAPQTNTNPIQLRAFEIPVPGSFQLSVSGGI